jgi:hypothetical protein
MNFFQKTDAVEEENKDWFYSAMGTKSFNRYCYIVSNDS